MAHAEEPCDCKVSQFREVNKLEDLIQKIGVIDDPDRRTEDDFALENKEDPAVVKRRYAATGAINCKNGKSYASAQLTIKGNIVTTSAHIFKNYETCAFKFEPSDCLFIFEFEGKQRKIRFEKKSASGFDGKSCPQDVSDDWVILKLSESVTEVNPYQVDQGAIAVVNDKSKVITVARSMDFRTVIEKG